MSAGKQTEKSTAGGASGAKDKEADNRHVWRRLQNVRSVCFEGPLGAHLKAEVREKIWKDEFVEIFSLLPLEKFNLDKVKRKMRRRGGIG